MGSCYSGDHIAEDHKRTHKTTCIIEVPHQKYRLGTVSNRLLEASACFTGSKHVLLDTNPNSKPIVDLEWKKNFSRN